MTNNTGVQEEIYADLPSHQKCGDVPCFWTEEGDAPCTTDLLIDQLQGTPHPMSKEQKQSLREHCRRSLGERGQ